jgi:hypothetical protein
MKGMVTKVERENEDGKTQKQQDIHKTHLI